jgi:hypothetical protein
MNAPTGFALRWPGFCSLLVLSLITSVQAGTFVDLSGHVTLPAGNSNRATILIRGAKPDGSWQSSRFAHYPALPRQVQTDDRGNFKIRSPDADWLFSGYVMAPRCRLQQFLNLTPAASPLNLTLQAADPAGAVAGTLVRGRVIDPEGRPIPGALVSIGGVTRTNWTTWPAYDIDYFAISDDAGNFAIYGKTPFEATEGGVEAPGFALGLFEHWAPGDEVHELTLVRGAAVQGRLLRGGKPVPNAEIRLDNFGAESDSELWHYSVLTDDRGRFIFIHLPPNRKCTLCATMESLGDRGALGKEVVQVRDNDSTNDLGDLNLAPAFRVAGRIQLSDGKPIPENSLLLLHRRMTGVQDSLRCALDPNGTFQFVGVPAEPVQVQLRVPGYELTSQDRYMIAGSATNITVAANLTGWVITMKPGSSM